MIILSIIMLYSVFLLLMLNTYFETLRKLFKEIYFIFELIIIFLFKKITDKYYCKKIKNFLRIIISKIDKLCNILVMCYNYQIKILSKHSKILKNEHKFFNSTNLITNFFSLNSKIIGINIARNIKIAKKKRNFLFFDMYYKTNKIIKFSFSKLNIDLFNFYLEYIRNNNLNVILSYHTFLKYFQNLKLLKISLKKKINKKFLTHEFILINNLECMYYYKNPLLLSSGNYTNVFLYFIKFVICIFFINIISKNTCYCANSFCILKIFFNKYYLKNKKEIIDTNKNILNYSFLYRKLIRKIKFVKLINVFKEDIEKLKTKNNHEILNSKKLSTINGSTENVLKANTQNIKNTFNQLYNPLKLPLGWDNKPIPYWLYKLHGLNEIFVCEICGNYKFHGRIAFERHFSETRHINGLRSLGIEYSKIYYEITTISKALELSNYFRKEQKEFKKEFEDQKGFITKEFF
uniref:mRNA splicing factor 3a subunit 3 n=1 Tax=Lotharella vacuolata TaxID=74820 RepID=A0A0H5BLB2_9EUKA|nr:mRNA splicing factor 3a subunit 3 [Lotharella vacuolata]